MATDFRISNVNSIEMAANFQKTFFILFHVFLIINQTVASSVWMPQFLSGGHGRNIRHLPCVSRKSGEQGICMFAYTCMKSNGTHLGTCIDRFYFGSCCKINGSHNELSIDSHINVPLISNNQVSSSHYPDESKISHPQTTSWPTSAMHKFTEISIPYTYPSSTPKTEMTSLKSSTRYGVLSDKTEVSSTHYSTPSTEKIYIPIHSSVKPNKTQSSGFFTTHSSSSGLFSQSKRPLTQSPSVTTPSFLLSTFQVVHTDNGENRTTVKHVTAKPTPSYTATTWTPIKHVTTATTSVRKNATLAASKPVSSTTTKKPTKPVKPFTTTRKPPPKKPTPKPATKPSASSATQSTKPGSSKPVQTTANKATSPKPATPAKKPTQPTKKPVLSTTKPPLKPVATFKPQSSSPRPGASNSTFSTQTVTTARTTTPKTTFTTGIPTTFTTLQTVFTKISTIAPGPSSTSKFGITTFRPDLTEMSQKPAPVTGPYLTTFNYTSEAAKEPTVATPAPTTPAAAATTTKTTTISNEIPATDTVFEKIPEIQEENTNVIFEQTDVPGYPGPAKQNDTTIPFFPEAAKPDSSKPWIEIVQSTSSEPAVSTTSKPLTTTTRTDTTFPLLSGFNTSDYTQVCGRRLFPQSRVVGGEKSTFGKWPWQISLRQWRTSTYLHKCGAALLNENWAITAAHCVENVPPSDLLLRLGEHDLSTEDEPYGFQERRVQIVASHPQFDPRTFEYDLALLRFYEPVKFQPNIIPVCVPEDSTNFVGQTAYVTGWGRLYEDGPLPSVLQEVSVPVINNTLCENMYRSAGYIEHIPEIFICAGWKKGGFDSCEGDSGGPMVIQRPDKRWLLAGVISWGIGCAEPNQPGVYTRISEFREWIHQILQF